MSDFSQNRAPWQFAESVTVPFTLPGGAGKRIILWNSVLMSLLVILGALLTWPVIKNAVSMFSDLQATSDMAVVMPSIIMLFAKLIGLYTLLGLIGMVISSSAEAAMLAVYLRGETRMGFPLRFDGDMWRVLGARLVVGIIGGGLFMVSYAMIFGAMLAGPLISGKSNGVLALPAMLIAMAGMVAAAFLAVRLSPLGAIAVRDKRFDLRAAMRASKGRFWLMVAGFVVISFVSSIAYNIVVYAGMVCVVLASGLFGRIDELDAAGPDFDGMAFMSSLLTPLALSIGLITLVIYVVILTITRLCMAGPAAHAAKLDANPAVIADTF